jgi:hypothetical protein
MACDRNCIDLILSSLARRINEFLIRKPRLGAWPA